MWHDRLQNSLKKYITPNNIDVASFANSIDTVDDSSPYQYAESAWVAVRNDVSYKLSKKWKTPVETLHDKTGDCEDYTFLLCSIFPHLNIKTAKIHAGNLKGNQEKNIYHAWCTVGGNVVDATTTPSHAKELTYEPVTTTTLHYQ